MLNFYTINNLYMIFKFDLMNKFSILNWLHCFCHFVKLLLRFFHHIINILEITDYFHGDINDLIIFHLIFIFFIHCQYVRDMILLIHFNFSTKLQNKKFLYYPLWGDFSVLHKKSPTGVQKNRTNY